MQSLEKKTRRSENEESDYDIVPEYLEQGSDPIFSFIFIFILKKLQKGISLLEEKIKIIGVSWHGEEKLNIWLKNRWKIDMIINDKNNRETIVVTNLWFDFIFSITFDYFQNP